MKRLISIMCVATACGGAPAGDTPPDAKGGDDVRQDDARPALEVDCSDLDAVIGLADQVAANANADRGRHPIVLAHGFFGFDRVGPLEYFVGVAEALRETGRATYVTAVEPIASSTETRAPELGRQIACIVQRSGAEKVNVIGHSQGGIEARVVAADPDLRDLVASVTTIATPHRGTLLADVSLGLIPGFTDGLANAAADLWGFVVGAPNQEADVRASMESMSSPQMVAFNARYPNTPGIAYFSWAGRSVRSILRTDRAEQQCGDAVIANPDAIDVIDPLLLAPFDLLSAQRGPNDGLVDVDSTKWGTFMGCVAADHLDQVGLFSIADENPISGFDHRVFFIVVSDSLRARGF